MIPVTLDQWSEAAIIELLGKHYYECEYFDFKQALPKDTESRLRMRQACCAFANSAGGFLVFGVDDNSAKAPADRLIGLNPALDFPEHFGNFPKECSPSLEWNFRNPPILLQSGHVIHVAHLPQSWYAPHAYRDSDGPWRFYKRTNKGNEPMSVEEIRMTFLGYYEKRLKLQLLRAELQHVTAQAQWMHVDEGKIAQKLSSGMFELNVIEDVFSDTYTLLVQHTELVDTIQNIRRSGKSVNNRVRQFLTDRGYWEQAERIQHTQEHNRFINLMCGQIEEYCRRATRLLDQVCLVDHMEQQK